jgi:AcrR family transcriptional regulator
MTEGAPEPEPACPGLRADAERNRERLLVAAREVFGERGLDVPLEDIARKAGVGVATLYRRFPSRADLISGAFGDKMSAYADAVAEALAEPDPWLAFSEYVETVCAMQASDRGFTDVLTRSFPTDRAFQAARDRAHAGFVNLIERAKDAGRLRADFVAEDLVLVLMANAGVVSAAGDAAPDAWRRVVAYFLEAFAVPNATPLPDPPTPAQTYRALLRVRGAVR